MVVQGCLAEGVHEELDDPKFHPPIHRRRGRRRRRSVTRRRGCRRRRSVTLLLCGSRLTLYILDSVCAPVTEGQWEVLRDGHQRMINEVQDLPILSRKANFFIPSGIDGVHRARGQITPASCTRVSRQRGISIHCGCHRRGRRGRGRLFLGVHVGGVLVARSPGRGWKVSKRRHSHLRLFTLAHICRARLSSTDPHQRRLCLFLLKRAVPPRQRCCSPGAVFPRLGLARCNFCIGPLLPVTMVAPFILHRKGADELHQDPNEDERSTLRHVTKWGVEARRSEVFGSCTSSQDNKSHWIHCLNKV